MYTVNCEAHQNLLLIIISPPLLLSHSKMYNFAIQHFIAFSIVLTAAADLITSISKSPPAELFNRRLQQQVECSCSPTIYTFQLNFNQTCNDNTIQGKPGVDFASCSIFTSANVRTPTQIEEIRVFEYGISISDLLNYKRITGSFFDGDTFSYTSASAELNPDGQLEDQKVPFFITVELDGVNAAGQSILNQINVKYDPTNCAAEPIQKEDQIGWVEVVDYTPAKPAFCPAIETESPTPSPVAASMSYSASLSLAHMSKASKGKAAKGGVSKSGKLNRERK